MARCTNPECIQDRLRMESALAEVARLQAKIARYEAPVVLAQRPLEAAGIPDITPSMGEPIDRPSA